MFNYYSHSQNLAFIAESLALRANFVEEALTGWCNKYGHRFDLSGQQPTAEKVASYGRKVAEGADWLQIG